MDEEEEGEEALPTPNPTRDEHELADGHASATLCVYSLVGFGLPHSMKVPPGKVKSWDVIVLIDSSASHNFISDGLVWELHLRCTTTQEFVVQMGNGDEIRTSGVCRELCLQLARAGNRAGRAKIGPVFLGQNFNCLARPKNRAGRAK